MKYLLYLELGGSIYRFSEKDEILYYLNGTKVVFKSGIVDKDISYILSEGSSISISISLDSKKSNILDFISRGSYPILNNAIFGYLNDEDYLDDFFVLLNGRINDINIDKNIFSFKITNKVNTNKKTSFIPETSVISNKTFPTDQDAATGLSAKGLIYDNQNEGKKYPFIFGSPGTFIKTSVLGIDGIQNIDFPICGAPCYLVETFSTTEKLINAVNSVFSDESASTKYFNQMILISGEAIKEGTKVTIYNANDESFFTYTTRNDIDFNGKKITVLESDPLSTTTIETGITYYSIFYDYDNDKKSEVDLADITSTVNSYNRKITGLGDLILYITRSSNDYDHISLESFRNELNVFNMSGYFDGDDSINEVIDKLIDGLPVIKINGRNGIYYRLQNYNIEKYNIRSTFTNNANVNRISEISFTDEIYNNFIFNYSKDCRTGKYTSQSYFCADNRYISKNATGYDMKAVASGSKNNYIYEYNPNKDGYDLTVLKNKEYLCTISEQKYGKIDKVYNFDYIWDETTISNIARYEILKYCMPKMQIEYESSLNLIHLNIGDIIYLNDDDYSITNRVAYINKIEQKNEKLLFSLIILE